MKIVTFLAFLLLSTSAHAAAIGKCEGLDSISNLVGNTKSFAQGAVKVAYISTEEPAAAPDHLLVFVYDNEMGVTCASVNATADGLGFGYVDMAKLTATYNPTKGLLLFVPVHVWTGEDGKYKNEVVKVRVNRRENTQPEFTLER